MAKANVRESRAEDMAVGLSAPLSVCAQVVRDGGGLIAFVVDAERRLIGAVTDGDIRRALLAGATMQTPASEAMNAAPIRAELGASREACRERMRLESIFQLPLVDQDGVLRDVALLSEEAAGANVPNRVVIMAGGLGSRLGELTKSTPKPMLLVGGRPLLQGIVERLIAAGFFRISISVNYLAEQIENHFGDGAVLGVEIDYLREKKRLGTAGCLSLLPQAPTEPIVVMNGDVLTDIDMRAMLRFHEENHAKATMALNNYKVEVPYGVVETEGHRVTGLREKPVYSFFVSAGVYILSPEAVAKVPGDVFYDMPMLFDRLMAEGEPVAGFPLHEYWLDVGRPNDLDLANELYPGLFDAPDGDALDRA